MVASMNEVALSTFAQRRTMMVDTQVRPADVTKFPIIDAMLSVPREDFVPNSKREAAYIGETLDLGGGRALLEPRSFAKMLDALSIDPRDVVLDLACGLGYSTAVIAHMAEFVVGIEDDAARAEEAQALLSEHGIDNAAIMHAELAEGAAKSGPYDIIIVEGGVETVPDTIIAQLQEGGRIAAVFLEEHLGVARVGHKLDGAVTWRYAFNAGAPLLQGFEKKRSFAL